MDPFLGGWSLPAATVFQPLLEVSAASGQLVAGLASSWHRRSDGALALALDPAAQFSDGTPVRASDVAFSLALARSAGPPLAALLGPVAATATGDATLLVRTPAPDAVLERRLATVPVVSQSAYDAPQAGVAPQLVGSGPYIVAGFDADRSLVLQASPNPWSGAPALERVAIHEFGSAASLLDALDAGVVELAQDLPASALSVLAGRFGLQVAPSGVVSFLVIRSASGPFSDLGARRAIAAALDPASLATGALGGTATPLRGQLAIPGTVGYSPAVRGARPDAAAARQLLAAAGHRGGLDTELAGPAAAGPLLEAVAAQLAAVGVRARVIGLDTARWLRELSGGGTGRWPLVLAEADLSPLFDVGPLYTSLVTASRGSRPLVSDPSFAAAAAEQAGELVPGRRAVLLERLASMIEQQALLVPLCSHGWVYGWSPAVTGLSVLGPAIDLASLSTAG